MTKRNIEKLLVLCDLDHTLTSHAGEMAECNDTLSRLFCYFGGRITVVTDRLPVSARPLINGMMLNTSAVCCGGSILYDFAEDEALAIRYLDRLSAEYALIHLMNQFPEVGVEVVTGRGKVNVVRVNRYVQYWLRKENLGYVLCPLYSLPDQWIKVYFLADGMTLEKIRAYADTQDFDKGLQFYLNESGALEMAPTGVDRISALKELCELEQIEMSDVCFISGRVQDIPLMRMVGSSASVPDAPREVIMAADRVTVCRRHEGAVAEYLYEIIKECGK